MPLSHTLETNRCQRKKLCVISLISLLYSLTEYSWSKDLGSLELPPEWEPYPNLNKTF